MKQHQNIKEINEELKELGILSIQASSEDISLDEAKFAMDIVQNDVLDFDEIEKSIKQHSPKK